MKNSTTRDIVYMALYAAIFVVLDYLTNLLNLFRMPQGGALSIGTVALLLASYHLGWKKGVVVCLVAVGLMFAIGSISYYGIVSFLLDYLLAYAAYGFASLIPNWGKYFYTGILVTSLVRLAFSTISGVVVWETGWWASLVYNASYMIPTMIVDLILVPLLVQALQPVIRKDQK
jgi:thiamine transporter